MTDIQPPEPIVTTGKAYRPTGDRCGSARGSLPSVPMASPPWQSQHLTTGAVHEHSCGAGQRGGAETTNIWPGSREQNGVRTEAPVTTEYLIAHAVVCQPVIPTMTPCAPAGWVLHCG